VARVQGDHDIRGFAFVVSGNSHQVAGLAQQTGPPQGCRPISVFRLFAGWGD
jgi:hypothetical protein